MPDKDRDPSYTFNDNEGERFHFRRGIFAVLAVFIVVYVIWLIVAGIFIFPLCSHCPIEALWAVLWVLALLSAVYVGYFAHLDLSTQDGLRKFSRAKIIAVRFGYGVAAFLAIVWFVLLVAYAGVFTRVGVSSFGKAEVQGIKGKIEIGMGVNNIMSVAAEDELDMAYGLGWGHATYRLFQMEIQRRIGQGKLAEVVGEGGLDFDKFTLTTGFYDSAVRNLQDMDHHFLAVAQAYVNGVNDFIRSNGKISLGFTLLGFKPKPVFSVADVLTYAKLVSYQLSGNWNSEIGRLQDHILRSVSGTRLSQLDPMDPQSTTTVISDAALGNRYAHIPPSTHRNVSLESEVDRLDAFMTSAGRTSASAVSLAAQTARRSAKRSETSRQGESSLEHMLQQEEETGDGAYLRDLLSMMAVGRGQSNIFAETLPEGGNVLKRAQSQFPSFFSAGRGFMKASNNWVVHGSRTLTGMPFLANDPHLTLNLPSIWMMASLNTSKYNAIGASFPGVPGIPIGRNNHVVWGVTNSGMDVQDLYVMDEVNATAYRHNGVEKAYVWRHETIKVKGKADVDWPVRHSVYGPVVNPIYEEDGDLGHAVSLKWTTLERNDTTVRAFYELLSVKNWDEFREALSHYVAPAQNFIYADKEGNIGYQLPGPIPIRVEGHTGTYPVPGNGSYDWIRYSDFWNESLWVLNPPEGYIVSANNMIATSRYPINILNDRDWEPRYRGQRITQLLNSPYKVDIGDMETIQLDTVSLFALEFVQSWRYFRDLSTAAKYWEENMRTWDGNELASSRQALVLNSLWAAMSKLIIPETDVPWQNPRYWLSMVSNATFPDPICAADGYDCALTLSKTFNSALKNRRITAKTKKNWGSYHSTALTSQIFGNSSVKCLFNRFRPGSGSPFTVNVANYNVDTLNTVSGPSYRQIVDVQDWDKSEYILPGGPAELITSPLYSDLYKSWADGEYIPLTTEDPYTHGRFTLNPKGGK
jgi:acyl-homoserine lactone acylase PvdQ